MGAVAASDGGCNAFCQASCRRIPRVGDCAQVDTSSRQRRHKEVAPCPVLRGSDSEDKERAALGTYSGDVNATDYLQPRGVSSRGSPLPTYASVLIWGSMSICMFS